MNYLKVKDNLILKFPYTYSDLLQENPSSNYDDRFTLPEWYSVTEECRQTGASVVEFQIVEQPIFDPAVYEAELNLPPIFVDGAWVANWVLKELPVLNLSSTTQT